MATLREVPSWAATVSGYGDGNGDGYGNGYGDGDDFVPLVLGATYAPR